MSSILLEDGFHQLPQLNDKLTDLTATKQNKLDTLLPTTGYKQDKLLGMQDADTPITRNLGNVRESDPTGIRYDAVELRHGSKLYDMYGIDKKTSPDAFGKSKSSMTLQREQVASILGKPVTVVTEQDMLDVGNQQQIQKLADLARGPGEKRWEAPLIKNSTQVNLTGKYVDDKGKKVNIPLNIDIATRVDGMDLSGKRDLASLQNKAGEDVTHLAATDASQNASLMYVGAGATVTANSKANFPAISAPMLTKDYSTVKDRAINTVQAVGATLVKEIGIDTADFVGELFGIGDVGTEEEKQRMANRLVGGYNASYSQEAMDSVKPQIDRLYKAATDNGEFNLADVYEVVKAGVLTPELAGESLGYMAGLLLGTGKFTKGAKAISAVKAEVTAGKLTQAEGIAKVGELRRAEEAMSRTQKAIAAVKDPLGFAGKNAGLLTVAAGNVNDQIDEYKKNNNGEGPSVGDVARMYGTEVFMNSLDRFTDVGILKNAGFMRGAKELVAGATEGQAAKLVGTLAAKGAMLTADIGKEAGQEFVQEFGQILNEQWGTKDAQGNERDFVRVLSNEENIKQGMTAAGMGAAGAIQFRGAGMVKDVLPATVNAMGEYSKRGLELATENEVQKIARLKRETIDPLVSEATDLVLAGGDTTTIEELVGKVHGNMLGIDENAPKKYTYSAILSGALSRAETEEEQDKVLDAIVKLDADTNSEFKANDILGDIVQGTIEEFVKTINEEGLDNIQNKLQENAREGMDEVAGPARDREVAKMLARLTTMRDKTIEKASKIKGSDLMLENLDASIELLDSYLKGKSVEDVNKEVATMGYVERDQLTGRVNVSKPGLATYESKLASALYNTKTQNNLTDKKVEAAGGSTLKNLAGFAESRVSKLQPSKKRESVYQTEKLAKRLTEENVSIVATINSVKEHITAAKGLTDENRTKYTEIMDKALADVEASTKHLQYVQMVLRATAKNIDTKGRLEFVSDKEGYSVVAKEGATRKTIARVVEGKLVPTGDKFEGGYANVGATTRSKEDIVSKPTVDEVVDAIQNRNKYTEVEAEQLIANASADGTLQKANKVLQAKADAYDYQTETKMEGEPVSEYELAKDGYSPATVKAKEPIKGNFNERFEAIVDRVASIDAELAATLKIDRLRATEELLEYRKGIVAKWKEEKSTIDGLITRARKVLETRSNSVLMGKILNKIMSSLQAMRDLINKFVAKKKEMRETYANTVATIDEVVAGIAELESEYVGGAKEVATGLGTAKVVEDSPYGAFAELKGKRKSIETKGDKPTEVEARKTINDIAREAVEKMKASDSLGTRLLANTMVVVTGAKAKIFSKGVDSVFGSVGKGKLLFGMSNKEIVDVLPKSFKDYFSASKEGKITLNENLNVMREFVGKIEIGEITEGKLGLSAEGTLHSVAKGASKKEVLNSLQILGTVVGKKKTNTVTLDILELDPQVEEIVKFYTAKAMSDASKVASDFAVRGKNDVMRDYGIVDDIEYEELAQYAMNGYVSAASIRNAVAQDVMKAIGLRVKKDVAEITEEGIKTALGTLVEAVAKDNGLFEVEENMTFSSKKTRTMVKPVWENRTGVEKNALTAAINKLQYMNESSARQLVGLKPIVDESKRKLNSTDYIDERTLRSINKQQSVAYVINDSFEQYIGMPEDEALRILGMKYIDKLHVSEVDKQEAINDKLVREFRFLKDSYATLKGKEFYLPWGQTASDRITIISDLNFQESKLHRDFINAKDDVRELEVDGDLAVFKVAVMQGLDMKPDKLGEKTVLGNFDKMVKVSKDGVSIDDGEDYAIVKKAVDSLIAHKVSGTEIDAEAMNAVFHSSEGFHGLSAVEALADLHVAIVGGESKFKPNLKVEIDAITSGMVLTLMQIGGKQAIDMMAKGGVYTKETKDKWEKYTKEWLGKDAVFTPGALIEAGAKHAKELGGQLKEAKTLEDRLAVWDSMKKDMFMDIYATAGIGMVSEVEKVKAKLQEEEPVGDKLAMLNAIGDFTYSSIRSIAKSPVMVYIYGASLGSIKKKLGYSLGIATVVDKMKELADIYDDIDANGMTAEKRASVKTLEEFVGRFTSGKLVDKNGKPLTNLEGMSNGDIVRHREIGKDNEDKILKLIAETFGTGLETSFNENFGFVDTYRAAIKSVEMITFEAYKLRLSKAIGDKLASKYTEVSDMGRAQLSKEDVVEINDELVKDGFGHGIAWNEDGEAKHQSLNKAGDKGTRMSAGVTVNGKTSTGQIRGTTSEVNTGASATISIHAIDSRLIQDTLNRAVGKYTGGNVYDAIVLALDKELLVDTANTYNTNTIETGFSRSILADNIDKLENMLGRMGKDELSELAKNLMVGKELKTPHSKEATRLKLDTATMFEKIREQVRVNNEERVENSKQEFYSGHSHIAVAGVTTVEAKGSRAKRIDSIVGIEKLLNDVSMKERTKPIDGIIGKIKELNITSVNIDTNKLAMKLEGCR